MQNHKNRINVFINFETPTYWNCHQSKLSKFANVASKKIRVVMKATLIFTCERLARDEDNGGRKWFLENKTSPLLLPCTDVSYFLQIWPRFYQDFLSEQTPWPRIFVCKIQTHPTTSPKLGKRFDQPNSNWQSIFCLCRAFSLQIQSEQLEIY